MYSLRSGDLLVLFERRRYILYERYASKGIDFYLSNENSLRGSEAISHILLIRKLALRMCVRYGLCVAIYAKRYETREFITGRFRIYLAPI